MTVQYMFLSLRESVEQYVCVIHNRIYHNGYRGKRYIRGICLNYVSQINVSHFKSSYKDALVICLC